ncbi:MAG: hypothetical protein WC314_04370 [Vulcanimicrobiota bacterium]
MQITSTRQRPIKETPYQKIKNSKIGRSVRDHKVGAGAASVAASAVIAGGAFQSDTFARVARYGIVPAAGTGVAVLGAAAVHDAVVNDVGENNAKATAKIALGTAAALGGTQVVGMAFDLPILDRAFTGVVFDHGQALLGGALLAGAGAAGKAAVSQFGKLSQDGSNKPAHAALGTGAAVGSVAAGLAGAELVGRDLGLPVLDRAFTGTLEFLAGSPAAAVAGGSLLVGGAAVAATHAGKNLISGSGNDYATAAMLSGAAAAGLGGLELAGHGLGLEATRGLFTGHAGEVGGLALSAFGGAVARHAAGHLRENGIGPLNSLGLTIGASALGAGAGVAAWSWGASEASRLLSNGTTAIAGAGLGLSTYAFGKKAVESARAGKLATAAFHGTGAAASAAGSLYALGSGLGIQALEQAGDRVIDVTVRPLAEHIIGPSLEFLFKNPALGGLGLAMVVGGFAYHQWSKD